MGCSSSVDATATVLNTAPGDADVPDMDDTAMNKNQEAAGLQAVPRRGRACVFQSTPFAETEDKGQLSLCTLVKKSEVVLAWVTFCQAKVQAHPSLSRDRP